MTLGEASAAFGAPVAPDPAPDADERDCYWAFTKTIGASLAFMVAHNQIAIVEVSRPGTLTAEGVGVGSSEAEVLECYKGKVRVEPHFYTAPDGHYLIVEQRPGAQIIFETDGKRVTLYRAGRLPEVGYVEGCL